MGGPPKEKTETQSDHKIWKLLTKE